MAYNKTNWQNLPSRDTPIYANNLNKMEEGIYQNSLGIEKIGDLTNLETTAKTDLVSAINELTPVVLYDDDSGSSGNIEIEDNISNYSRIDIVVKTTNNNIYNTLTFYDPNGKNLELRTGNAETGLTDYYLFVACTMTFSGTTGTRTNNRVVSLRNGNAPAIGGTPSYYNLLVTQVIGYK